MANIDLNLTARVEDVREPQRAVSPVHFELAEIKKHFDESLTGIEKQGETAAKLLENGQEEECQDIWRSQIVFLEGVLDFFLHEISKKAKDGSITVGSCDRASDCIKSGARLFACDVGFCTMEIIADE